MRFPPFWKAEIAYAATARHPTTDPSEPGSPARPADQSCPRQRRLGREQARRRGDPVGRLQAQRTRKDRVSLGRHNQNNRRCDRLGKVARCCRDIATSNRRATNFPKARSSSPIGGRLAAVKPDEVLGLRVPDSRFEKPTKKLCNGPLCLKAK